jgi:Na+/melibiose symporter-like transporter
MDEGREAARARFGAVQQFLLSCFWFAYNFHWGALLAIVLPSQIAALVGDERKELWNGLLLGAGALLSLVVTPVAGALSDRTRSRFGRRRPWMLAGTALNVALLLLIGRYGAGSPLLPFALLLIGIQFANNVSGGPYAGLIPDQVPPERRGAASGWMALMTALGTIAGVLAAGQLARGGDYRAIDALIAGVLALFLALTLAGVRERPLERDPGRFDARAFLRSFVLDPGRNRDFYWVLATRALVTMGIYSVFTFFQFFLKDIVRVARPEEQASYLIGIIIATGIPTSLLAGSLSDRLGRKPMIYWSGGLMSVAAVAFIPAALFPSLGFTFAIGALFGVGYGAYQAVDWALAVDVLPEMRDAAKDMGIWHVALVLPQVLAPTLTGATLALLKPHSLLLGYTVVFVITATWFVLGTVLVRRVRGVR